MTTPRLLLPPNVPQAAGIVQLSKQGRSSLFYLAGIAAAWLWQPGAGMALFVAVAPIWPVPDRRIERRVAG